MIRKIPANARHKAEHDWLTTYHLFSFAMYFDRGNMNFGALRVFNDDYIDGENGFGAHSHDNMEIITIVHKGTLTHQDSMGNTGTIGKGEVQYMSAGTGVTHAEVNREKEQIHLYQIWIMPDKQNLTPQYYQKDFSDAPKNILVPVASGQKLEGAISIQTSSTIYISQLESGKTIRNNLENDRGLFIYIKEGGLIINGKEFEKEDQARIMDEPEIIIKT
ncbi:MAG TPA: pirin family protein, partial [Candidatus Doudnabacteria bacterium]|nr:pirin family protein [Candidatus Doudnabacteria bacterium]